jgi:glycosyltransferase involved in cell wall biosynthesis
MTKTLKIFVDCHVFDESFQGTTSYIRGLYQELIKDKSKNFFLAANDIVILKSIFGEAENICYLSYASPNKFYRLLVDIPRLIKKHNIDYAHFQYIVPPIKYCKYINTIHDVLFMDYPDYFTMRYRIQNKFLFLWSARYSDLVLTVSEYSKNQIQQHFGIKNITLIPNAVDPVFFETYNKEIILKKIKSQYNFENYWIYISRWEPRKNHHTLLNVFVENKYYEEYSMVFVGDTAIHNKEFNQIYERLDSEIKDKIIILNKVNFNELLLLLRGAKLSVYPSIAEGFGIPPLEAIAAGITSVCSNTTAMGDFDFLEKLSFNPLDKEDLKEKIDFALQSQNNKANPDLIQIKYNWESSAAIFNKVIDENQKKL